MLRRTTALKLEVLELENRRAQLDVTVDETEVAKSLDGAYRKIVKEVNIPGFRKGKAPRHLIEARYGVEALYQDAIDILLPQAYEFALGESKLEPIDRPEVDVIEFEKGKEAVMRFVIQLPPTITLGEYKGIEVTQAEATVSDEQVEAELAKLQQQHVRLVDATAEVVDTGHLVNINYAGRVDGELFDGGSAENQNLEIGSGSFIPGFEEQVIGMQRDEERDITVTFPAEYHSEDLAGKEAVFSIKLNDIKEKVMPELNDDFAKEISEHETMDDLRAEHREKLVAAAERNRKTQIENAVVSAAVEAATVEIPSVMVEGEIDSMIEDLKFNLSRSGLEFDMYLQYLGKTEDEMRTDFAAGAGTRVKTRLVIDEIAKAEAVEVTEEDLELHLEEMARPYGQTGQQAREMLAERGQLHAVRESLVSSKTIDLMVNQAVVKTE
jgi:trigger factor